MKHPADAATPPPPTTLACDRSAWFALNKECALQALFATLTVLGCLTALSRTVADPDLWGYLAFGRLFWESGRFPYHDIFAYVPTRSLWVYHEWLTGVVFYPVYRALGAPGLQALKFALGLATVYLVYLTARRRGAGFWAALLGLWAVQVFLTMGYSPVRAQVFTYFFFALSLYVLESVRLSGRWRGLLVLVLIQIPWCNLHGGFLAGLGLPALYALGEGLCRRPYRPYAAALLAGSLVTLINPYGLDYWSYLYRALAMPRPEIAEWASVVQAWQDGVFRMTIIRFVSLAGFAALLAWWAGWRELTPGLVLLFTFYLGLKHYRHEVFFFVAAGAYLPALFQSFGQKVLRPRARAFWDRGPVRLALLSLALVGLLGFGGKFLSKNPLSLDLPATPDNIKVPFSYPVAAVGFIRTHHLSGNILNEFNWGEYLIWSLQPSCKVAMDGRYETVYSDEVYRLYVQFILGRPGWRQFLQKFPPDLILVAPTSEVYPLLVSAPDWRQVYRDAGAALFLPR